MYISEVNISGYKNYRDTKIPLHDGINMIIGPNNSGKSNLLQAIALVLNVSDHKRIDVNDIFCETDIAKLKAGSPKVSISIVIKQSEGEDNNSEQAGLLRDYLVNIPFPYEAQLNFQYSLSADQEVNYLDDVSALEDHVSIWNVIRNEYARFYEIYRWGGQGVATRANLSDLFDRCDFQFLDAIRDVGKTMFAGYNPMLRDVLNFFVDYDLKISEDKQEEEIKEEVRAKQNDFKEQAKPLMQSLLERLESGKSVVLDYAKDTGASFGNVVPDFSGVLSESELFAVLRLIIRYETGVEIPATNNGLGYNNLIYMSLLLAKMQAMSDGKYMKRQAKLYSLLAVEEPEAHLHPSMQYQLLNFLNKNKREHNVNQIIVTTHSTQIVSAVEIDDIVCLSSEGYGIQHAGYPRLAFEATPEDILSKAYVQRFLDATRSDMFFANKLIFVEGIAEEILIPTFARYLGLDLTEKHVLIVNMGGRYFNHFLKMFDCSRYYGIRKKIACITDIDPCCDGEACYPYEYGTDEHKIYSHNADDEIANYAGNETIRYFRQDSKFGKTLEYDIAFYNSTIKEIVVDGMKNQTEIITMMSKAQLDEILNAMRKSDENERIKKSINACVGWSDEEKIKATIASRYLNSVSKGSNALALSLVLEENLKRSVDDPKKFRFNVPTYIEEALTWLLQ